jgi:ribonuclease HI
MLEHALNIYTDGSSYSGPRTAGIGIRFHNY